MDCRDRLNMYGLSACRPSVRHSKSPVVLKFMAEPGEQVQPDTGPEEHKSVLRDSRLSGLLCQGDDRLSSQVSVDSWLC